MPLPSVTVCTITHNRRPLLPLLQRCLLAQDYPLELLQWVVVDDSTTGALPDLGPARQAGMAVLWRELPERLPIGAKRNLANELASGELIVVMDDDDYYPPSRISHAVERLLASGAQVAGCDRLPLLLLPEASGWFTPPYSAQIATANSLAYWRSFLEAGHRFDPGAEKEEEPAFLAGPDGELLPLLQLDPFRTLVCIGHGGNTVDKRTWMAVQWGQGFERLSPGSAGFPDPSWLGDYCSALGLRALAAAPTPAASGGEDPAGCRPWRVAVITPYHHEPLELIERCHASVQAQTVPCVHVLVADGPLRPEVAELDARHIVLGVGHADNGNTPRSIGALAAMNEGFTCIAFLDADNWFSPDHLERAIAAQAEGEWEVVFSDRHIVFPNGQRLLTPPAEDLDRSHVDTSCMVIFPPAFASLALWAQMPPAYAPLCDRVMFSELMGRYRCGWSGCASLYFETWYYGHFLAAGFMPPLNAKYQPCRTAQEWAAAATRFRQQTATPIYPGALGTTSGKPRINLITIHAASAAAGQHLQGQLCQYFGFAGIAANDFLWHWQNHFGDSASTRRSTSEIVASLCDSLPLQGLETMFARDRSYTAIEAYFRVVIGTAAAEDLQFSRQFGAVNLLDSSPRLADSADLLWAGMPLHQGLLLLEDPLVIHARRGVEAEQAHRKGANGIQQLMQMAEQLLLAVLQPLRAAPPGQISILGPGVLEQAGDGLASHVSTFLGMAPNPVGAMEPLPKESFQACSAHYYEELNGRIGALQERYRPLPHTPGCELSDEERHWLQNLYSPLAPWLSRDGVAPQAEGIDAAVDRGPFQPLSELVRELEMQLHRHQPLQAAR